MGADGTSGPGATPDPGEIEKTARELVASQDAYVRREMGAAPGVAPPAWAPAACRMPPEASPLVDPAETDRVVGQLLDQVVGGAPTPPSNLKPTVDDLAAYVGLVALSQPAPSLPEAGPVGSPRRLGRLLLLSGFAGLVGIFLLLAVMQARPGGETPAPVAPRPTPHSPAEMRRRRTERAAAMRRRPTPHSPAEMRRRRTERAAARPSLRRSSPGGAAIPASCLVPQGGALDLELADVTWREETDGLNAS